MCVRVCVCVIVCPGGCQNAISQKRNSLVPNIIQHHRKNTRKHLTKAISIYVKIQFNVFYCWDFQIVIMI